MKGFNKQKFKVTDEEFTQRIKESQAQLLVGKQRGLTKQNCFVEIHSPNVVNLTVVDLPGLVTGLYHFCKFNIDTR